MVCRLVKLYSKPATKTEFEPIHLALISFVVITAKVQQTMENQLFNFICKTVAGLFSLGCRAIDRDYDVAQVRFEFRFKLRRISWKRQDVGRIVFPPIGAIELFDLPVRDKHDCCFAVIGAHRLEGGIAEVAPLPRINPARALAIHDLNHYRFPIANFRFVTLWTPDLLLLFKDAERLLRG